MKKNILHLLTACIIIVFSLNTKAQDPHFSQFFANPIYTNPAFAGSAICPRVGISYRDQWPSLGAFKTFAASYDQYFDALSGGLGVYIMSDKQSDFYRINTAELIYSLRVKINNDITLNLAAQANITNHSLDFDKLVFGDMIDTRYGVIYTSTQAEHPDETSKTYFDIGTGAVIYSDNWYAGVAAVNLLRPDNGFNSYNRVPVKVTANAGMRFNLRRDQRRTNAFFGQPVISPNIIFQHQGKFNTLNYGAYLDWSPFIFGAWFRQSMSFSNADALVLLFGVEWGDYKIGYSYDITVSSLSNVSGGAHEITLGAKFPCPEKHKKIRAIRCPSF
ncbi:MAG: PorP/SprF family type IX secretion system membrane protein [Bacteroidales bacterium]|nr:PorP/SprF family type IX secretion system membrane protein [Bacteroidales bacterium]